MPPRLINIESCPPLLLVIATVSFCSKLDTDTVTGEQRHVHYCSITQRWTNWAGRRQCWFSQSAHRRTQERRETKVRILKCSQKSKLKAGQTRMSLDCGSSQSTWRKRQILPRENGMQTPARQEDVLYLNKKIQIYLCSLWAGARGKKGFIGVAIDSQRFQIPSKQDFVYLCVTVRGAHASFSFPITQLGLGKSLFRGEKASGRLQESRMSCTSPNTDSVFPASENK